MAVLRSTAHITIEVQTRARKLRMIPLAPSTTLLAKYEVTCSKRLTRVPTEAPHQNGGGKVSQSRMLLMLGRTEIAELEAELQNWTGL